MEGQSCSDRRTDARLTNLLRWPLSLLNSKVVTLNAHHILVSGDLRYFWTLNEFKLLKIDGLAIFRSASFSILYSHTLRLDRLMPRCRYFLRFLINLSW
jgi:hypothetical protein